MSCFGKLTNFLFFWLSQKSLLARLEDFKLENIYPGSEIPFYITLAYTDHHSDANTALDTNAKLNIDNDLDRETEFESQALRTVEFAEAQLKLEGKPFWRPDDYFAEMLKTDTHMSKVK